MNELALFAGAGGGILGGHLLGWRTVCAVEWEPYPASVLCARQNDKVLPPFPVWDDCQTFDGKPWRGIVDVVSGGFPCQDISAAGKGAGITGTRSSMWKHMARIIGEVRPQYVYVENSPMLVTRGLDVVLADLAALGFNARWGVVSAADVGANHKRERIWILANTQHFGGIATKKVGSDYGIQQQISPRSQLCVNEFEGTSGVRQDTDMAYTINEGLRSCGGRHGGKYDEKNRGGDNQQIRSGTNVGIAAVRKSPNLEKEIPNTDCERRCSGVAGVKNAENAWQSPRSASRPEWWDIEPNVGRVAHGVASRVDRLKAIGNGQVPQVARTAWGLLK